MFGKKRNTESHAESVHLLTAGSSFEADIIESKLRAEGIPCLKKYEGSSNFMEIFMGSQSGGSIEIYVPEKAYESALEAVKTVPLEDDFTEAQDGGDAEENIYELKKEE
ncbi:MAG: DUF2007 domain-containing protein [Firmicutes bacterium]|nr:DUF2007 domain-containing protein [Bacillota bacterium]